MAIGKKGRKKPDVVHKQRIVKGDRVRVIRGVYRDVEGNVLRVLRDEDRLVVEGVNERKHHKRQSGTDEGGIVTYEAPIHVSNVMLVDPASGEASRIRMRLEEDGTKERIAVKSGNPIPKPQ